MHTVLCPKGTFSIDSVDGYTLYFDETGMLTFIYISFFPDEKGDT